MGVRWKVEPFDGASAPLSLIAVGDGGSQSIPVGEADLEHLFAVLADRMLNADQPGPGLEHLRRWAAYEIGDPAWADQALEVIGDDDPDARHEREEEWA